MSRRSELKTGFALVIAMGCGVSNAAVFNSLVFCSWFGASVVQIHSSRPTPL